MKLEEISKASSFDFFIQYIIRINNESNEKKSTVFL